MDEMLHKLDEALAPIHSPRTGLKAGAAISAVFTGMALAASNPMPYFGSEVGGTSSRKKASDVAKQKRKAKIAAQSKRRNRK